MTWEIQLILLCVGIVYVKCQSVGTVGGEITINDPISIQLDRDRIDPELLCRTNCFEIGQSYCKIRHPTDCRSYIVCDAKHPSYRQSCGFGTFFRETSGGCVHRNDADCPARTDICSQFPKLSAYPDYEMDIDGVKKVTNCKQYYRCENGRSVPACCEGYFDRNAQDCRIEIGRNRKCSDICQMRIGSVEYTKTKTQVVCSGQRVAIECKENQFIKIEEGFLGRKEPLICNGPQVWSRECGANVTDILRTLCHGKKRTCNVSPNEQYFIGVGTCGGTVSQYLEVRYRCKTRCNLLPVPGRGNEHLFKHRGASPLEDPQTCPPTTVFSRSMCSCVTARIRSNRKALCQLHISIDFKQPGDQTRRLPVYNRGNLGRDVLETANIESKRNMSHFAGKSYICSAFYQSNDQLSKQFGFHIRLYLDKPRSQDPRELALFDRRQVILSNCEDPSANNAPVEVSVMKNATGRFMVFRVIDINGIIHAMSLPVELGRWYNILYYFNKKELTVKLQWAVNGRTEELVSITPFLNGKIKLSRGSLCIGGCKTENGLYDGLYAYVDEIQISACKDA